MSALYLLGAFTCLACGTWIIYIQVKKFKAGTQDQLGFDIKLLGAGIIFMMGGIAMLVQFFYCALK